MFSNNGGSHLCAQNWDERLLNQPTNEAPQILEIIPSGGAALQEASTLFNPGVQAIVIVGKWTFPLEKSRLAIFHATISLL
jgi:hypothetical protein